MTETPPPDRPAVVLATRHTAPMSGLETVIDALYDADRADLPLPLVPPQRDGV